MYGICLIDVSPTSGTLTYLENEDLLTPHHVLCRKKGKGGWRCASVSVNFCETTALKTAVEMRPTSLRHTVYPMDMP